MKVDLVLRNNGQIIEKLNRAEKLISELKEIVVDLSWYGLNLELIDGTITPKQESSAEK